MLRESKPARESIRGVWAAVAFTVVLAVLALTTLLAPAAPAARTLVVSPTPIRAFAQDGRFLAWVAQDRGGFDCGRVFVRNLATGRQRSFIGKFDLLVCANVISLARGRVVWPAEPLSCGICFGASLFTAALGDPRVSVLGEFVESLECCGRTLTAFTGGSQHNAISWVDYNLVDEACEVDPIPCVWDVTGGRVDRVVGRRRHRVMGTGPAVELAVGAGRLASAPAADQWEGAQALGPHPVEDGPVEVVEADSGAPVMRVNPTGTVRALALSRAALAVLIERASGGVVIERYRIPSGRLLASTSVKRSVSDVDIGRGWIVYRVWRQIHLLDARGTDKLLVKVPTRPIGVSIEGHRVAWAQNNDGRHRIRAIRLLR